MRNILLARRVGKPTVEARAELCPFLGPLGPALGPLIPADSGTLSRQERQIVRPA